jgi:hypothetical protein
MVYIAQEDDLVVTVIRSTCDGSLCSILRMMSWWTRLYSKSVEEGRWLKFGVVEERHFPATVLPVIRLSINGGSLDLRRRSR